MEFLRLSFRYPIVDSRVFMSLSLSPFCLSHNIYWLCFIVRSGPCSQLSPESAKIIDHASSWYSLHTSPLKLTCIDIRINTLCVGFKLLSEICFYNAVPPSQQCPEEAITIAQKKKKIVRVHTISRLNEINLNLMYDRQL